MTNEFIYDKIKEQELTNGTLFIGYFSPNGKLYSFNTNKDLESHYSAANPVASKYLDYISYVKADLNIYSPYRKILEEFDPEKYKRLMDKYINELVFRGYNSYYTGNVSTFKIFYDKLLDDYAKYSEKIKTDKADIYDSFILDLLKFYVDAYKNGSFIKSTGLTIKMDSIPQIIRKISQEENILDINDNCLSELIKRRVSKEMLTFFKDLCIRYLGYDSIEKYNKDGVKITIPNNPEQYEENFFASPRVITTSHVDIYERYYNYILMDWYINKVPKYTYNEKTGIFELDDGLNPFIEQREEGIKEELKILKKNYSPKDRLQFIKN